MLLFIIVQITAVIWCLKYPVKDMGAWDCGECSGILGMHVTGLKGSKALNSQVWVNQAWTVDFLCYNMILSLCEIKSPRIVTVETNSYN